MIEKRKPSRDLTGETFGFWTVLRKSQEKLSNTIAWDCKCICGTERAIRSSGLLSGQSSNCGCKRKGKAYKHGATCNGKISPEYRSWQMMVQRCTNPKATSFESYGGSGITVCNEWLNSFETFLKDMGPRPSVKYSIDRIDSTKGYCPDNCRWIEKREQPHNFKRNVLVSYQGSTMPLWHLMQSHNTLGLKYSTVFMRVTKLGWKAEDAISTPAQKRS